MLVVTDLPHLGRTLVEGRGNSLVVRYKDGRVRCGSLAPWCRERTTRLLFHNPIEDQTVDIFGINYHHKYCANQPHNAPLVYKPYIPNNDTDLPPHECGQRFFWYIMKLIATIVDGDTCPSLRPSTLFYSDTKLPIITQEIFPGQSNIIDSCSYYTKADSGALINIPGRWLKSIPIASFLLYLPRVLYSVGNGTYVTSWVEYKGAPDTLPEYSTEQRTLIGFMQYLGWSTLAISNTNIFWIFIYFLLLISRAEPKSIDLFAYHGETGFQTWLYWYMGNGGRLGKHLEEFSKYIHKYGLYGFIDYPYG